MRSALSPLRVCLFLLATVAPVVTHPTNDLSNAVRICASGAGLVGSSHAGFITCEVFNVNGGAVLVG